MSMKAFIKGNKAHPVIRPLYRAATQARRLWRKVGIDTPLYHVYAAYCSFRSGGYRHPDPNDYRKNFTQKHILALPGFLGEAEVAEILLSLQENVRSGNTFNDNDLLYPEKPGIGTQLVDRYLRNLVIYYNFPRGKMDPVAIVRYPVKNVRGYRSVLEGRILPMMNTLMASSSRVIRAFAMVTKNRDGEETHNINSAFHFDGDVDSSVKCIVYLEDVDLENGPFCYIDGETGEEISITGEAGMAIFFRSSLLRHRGSNTLKRPRHYITVLCHPDTRDTIPPYDVRPDFVRHTVPFLPSSTVVQVK